MGAAMHYPLIAANLDQVLLNARHRFPRSVLSAINDYISHDGHLVLITERSESSTANLITGLPVFDHFHIFHNGAIISNLKTGVTLDEHHLHSGLCDLLFNLADCYKLNPIVYYRDQIFVSKMDRVTKQLLGDEYGRQIQVDHYAVLNRDQVVKIVFCGSQADLESIIRQTELLTRDFRFSIDPKLNRLTILSDQADEGAALAAIADKLAINLSECLAIGFSRSDLDMMKRTGASAALASAEPVVVQSADFTVHKHLRRGIGDLILSNL